MTVQCWFRYALTPSRWHSLWNMEHFDSNNSIVNMVYIWAFWTENKLKWARKLHFQVTLSKIFRGSMPPDNLDQPDHSESRGYGPEVACLYIESGRVVPDGG